VKLAVLHPGAMGATIGAALTRSGHQVRWLRSGRSQETADRATEAGLEALDDLRELIAGADGIVSVCPPHAALEVARSVEATGHGGLYVDANAVAPATARKIHGIFGERFVDGGIIGPPALRAGTTRLYLSGDRAEEAAGWFADEVLGVQLVDGPAGAASALKMCYAAYTKGTSALLLAIRALAEAEEVTEALLGEWQISQPDLAGRSSRAAQGTAGKAWRFVGEMEEIASTFAARDLPGGFHEAAAEIYRRMSGLKDADDPDLAAVLAALTAREPPSARDPS
jgi:3-hydroxyisobutyrate dehydrogenase-like beta-hydroxyacid dehydrogenase